MPFIVTAAHLRAIAGAKAPRVEEIADAFNASAGKFGLDRELRAAHFMAQIAHESGNFRYVREIWGPTSAQSRYEGRTDLGNTRSGDGKRFMGRGLIQITGRANAREFTAWACKHYPDAPDFEADPALMERFPWALVGAFWYWDTRRLNALADKDYLEGVTKVINGGTNGLADRRVKLALAKKAFSAPVAIPPGVVPTRDDAGRPTLRKGAKGDAVRQLQLFLGIRSDGDFGKRTQAALIEFQRAHGLLPDGVAGPLTWDRLTAPELAA